MREEDLRDTGVMAIIPWGSRELPLSLDALVLPEDTYLLLQDATEALDPEATPLDLWAALQRAGATEKRPLGSVLIGEGSARGVKYVARVVVVDFDAEPMCRTEVVGTGVEGALRELKKLGCETVGVFPVPGMRGGVSREAYVAMLREVRTRLGGEAPRTLYLLEARRASGADLDNDR